nr:crosslink repair DNA glycosylase YcaQ family protein [Pseudomonas aeruginosa]
MSLSLSLAEARRLALAAQGFDGRRTRRSVQRRHLREMLARLGLLQIDSVNALVRSHYLPLFSRLGPYSMTLLDEAAWSVGRHRQLFEYWGHEASLLPLEHYPLMRWRMRQAADGQGIYQQLARFGREQQPLIRQVLQAVREQGALGAGSLSTRQERAGPWWDWSAEKHALEWLFAAGELTVAGRRGFERLYDLPERGFASALLSPFDSLVWERVRAERLFDFRYRLEIYTPKEKRVYGYYVLPFLYNGRLVGRVDLRAERARERLAVHALHAEANGMDDAALHELAEQLRSMAAWLGLATVAIEGGGELAVRLRGVLL